MLAALFCMKGLEGIISIEGEDFRSLMDCELVLNKPAQTSEVSTPVF